MRNHHQLLRRTAFTALVIAATACAPPPERVAGTPAAGAAGGSDDTTEVTIALTQVPAGVTCVRIESTVNGAVQPAVNVLTTPGGISASLSIGRLPAGPATIKGGAFALACTDPLIATTPPTWIALPVQTTLVLGAVNNVPLTFRQNNPVTIAANFIKNVSSVAVGRTSSMAVMVDGTVKTWGQPTGSTGTLLPTDIAGVTGVVEAATGAQFSCLRTSTGAVLCWGQLPPSGTTVTTPTSIVLPAPAIQIAVGTNHACAVVRQNATSTQVYCWGTNTSGQLGNGTMTSSATPVPVLGLGDAVQVAASGATTCAIQDASTAACWGENASGQVGDGSTIDRPLPIPLVGIVAVSQVTVGGSHACLLRADGSARCWGDNLFGQLGDGSIINKLTPTPVLNGGGIAAISAGAQHTCARRTNGEIVCWGSSLYGQGGEITGGARTQPFIVPGLDPTQNVAVDAHDANHTCALLADSSLRCWGSNAFGQLGDNTNVARFAPVPVQLQ